VCHLGAACCWLVVVGTDFLAGQLQWVRMLKVGPASPGSNSRGLVQILSRKRMMNGSGEMKGARAPLQHARAQHLCCWEFSVILVPLCCGFSGCALAWGQWQQVTSVLQPEVTSWFCSFPGLFTLLVEDFGKCKKPSWGMGVTHGSFSWALHQLLPFVCRGQGSAG